MPIYSYRCDACGNEFDMRESFDAPAIRDCTCGEPKTARRIIHPVGVIYKGSGFYTTDYRRSASSGSNGTSSSSSSRATSSDSSGDSSGSATSAASNSDGKN